MTADQTKAKEGWKFLDNARKAHYFQPDGRALCGRWLTWSNDGCEQGNEASPDNCTECRKRLVKRKTE